MNFVERGERGGNGCLFSSFFQVFPDVLTLSNTFNSVN